MATRTSGPTDRKLAMPNVAVQRYIKDWAGQAYEADHTGSVILCHLTVPKARTVVR